MTDQASLLEETQPPHIPQRNFFEHCGHLGVFVLLAKRLDNTQLPDPETGAPQPSLRQACSSQGLCYVRVRKPLAAEGHYWADVWADADAATSDLTDRASDAYVMLSEEDLAFTLAWDERLQKRDATQIRRLIKIHARELALLRPRTESVLVADPPPAPSADVCADHDEAKQLSVEVTEHDLPEMVYQGGLTVQSADVSPTAAHSSMHINPVAPYVMQRALLCTMRKALKRQLAQTHNRIRGRELEARCALVARVQEWQRRTRQRVVHVEGCSWCFARQCLVWNLRLNVPEALLAESASAA